MCPILLTTLATFAQATESVEPLVFDPAAPDAGLEFGHAADPKKGLTLPVFHDQHFAHRDTPFVLDPDCVVLPLELQAAEGRFQPMIQEGETGFVPSPHFTGMAKTLGIMNKLAYSRGQDYRNGHELTYQGSLDGWTLTNIKAKRGWGSDDPNAGFVAYHKGLRTIAIVMHGSINGADWITNFKTWAVRLDAPHPLPRRADEGDGAPVRFARLPFVGFAHKGFLEKYLSASEEVMEAVDRIMDGIRASLKEGLWGMVKSAGYAQHMGTDNVNYRGVGKSYAFDPDMVDQSLQDLKQGLQMAYDHQQDRLRAQAVRANPNTSSWERFKAWMK
jgi:hypothetical protein